MALTFDDLPATGVPTCDTAAVRDVTTRLTTILRARGVPAMGLITPGRPCLSPAFLQETLGRWRAIGATLGNHTATHPDLNVTAIDAYFADIARAQALIDRAVPSAERWFRPPYLRVGDRADKKQALESYLAAHSYRMAPVTVDNQEYVYAAVYARARAHDDDTLAARVADAYVRHLEEATIFYERLSVSVFGREIPQVMLLHANLLNAEQLGRVLDMLEGRGYDFVTMHEALADSGYARTDTYVGRRGLSWIQRWALAAGVTIPDEPREAPWVARLFR